MVSSQCATIYPCFAHLYTITDCRRTLVSCITNGEMQRVHIIGAGLAGLSAAVALAGKGRSVAVYESASVAGGRARSYFDKELGLRIDNGNHLLLSGNAAAFRYIDTIGSRDQFDGPGRPFFPFVDLKRLERWTLRPNKGRIPWWILSAGRRVPGTWWRDYLELRSFTRIKDDRPVADVMRRGRLYWRLVEPFALAALNTRSQVSLARLLGAVMRETLLRGGRACIPWYPRAGLSEALVDPAIEWLTERGSTVHLNQRVTGLLGTDGRVTRLETVQGPVEVGPDESVVLAVPPWIAGELFAGLVVPDQFESILNIHFRLPIEPEGPIGEAGFAGIIDGVAEWLFIKDGHVSVTISAANGMIDEQARTIANAVWPNVKAVLELTGEAAEDMPPFRVVKEKRATFIADAAQDRRRPGAETAIANMVLAGDYTATGLPATIEGAIRSGETAAGLILGRNSTGRILGKKQHGVRRPRTTIMFRPE
jgi:hydroxysqualene dehydroxylase